MQNKNKNLIILNFRKLNVSIGHVFGQIKSYGVCYFCESLGGRWIGCCPVQGCCNGCLGRRWTRTGILWINISFGLHAFLIFKFVMFFQVIEQISGVTLRGRHYFVALFANNLLLFNVNCPESETSQDNGCRPVSRHKLLAILAFDITCSHRSYSDCLTSCRCRLSYTARLLFRQLNEALTMLSPPGGW